MGKEGKERVSRISQPNIPLIQHPIIPRIESKNGMCPYFYNSKTFFKNGMCPYFPV